MQFIPLDNFYSGLALIARSTDRTFYKYDGTTVSWGTISNTSYCSYASPFWVDGVVTSHGTETNKYLIQASSSDDISKSTHIPLSVVGTTQATIQKTSKGQTFIITVTGSGQQEETIKSLFFGKQIYVNTSNIRAGGLFFALKLDTPVELNAENNYTANFTFAIEF